MHDERDSIDGELDELIGRFDEMVRHDKLYFFDVDEFEEIIDFYFEHHNNRRVQVAIDHALRQHPSSHIFLLRKAQYLADINKLGKALEILQKLEMLEPQNPDVYLTLGTVYSKLKKIKQAIDAYYKAIEYSDEKDDIYIRIAFEYEELNDYDKAIKYLIKALDFNPNNQSVIYELSFCFELAGRVEDAIVFF